LTDLPTTTRSLQQRVEAWEAEFLVEGATRSYPAIRGAEEPDSPLRTPFQRDRDRIVHSKAFRRLKHKTQVFIAPEGDHYRTRLTHTLEASGISRTVARALGLNEDLTEAIGLGHDLGHPPFGHIGEEALDEALRERCGSGFKHNLHSLRTVDVLERDIAQREAVGGAMLRLRKFMFDRVYLGPEARREVERVQRTLRGLFDHYMDEPEEVPALDPHADLCQRVTDYVAGMTDRFCISQFRELAIPEEAHF